MHWHYRGLTWLGRARQAGGAPGCRLGFSSPILFSFYIYSSLIISLTNQFEISLLFQNRTIIVAPSFGDPNPQQEKSQRRPAIVIQVGVVEGCYTNVTVVIGPHKFTEVNIK